MLPISLIAQFDFGFKAGLNSSNVSHVICEGDADELISSSSPKLGAYAGLMFERHLSSRISAQGELLYSMKGFKDGIRKFSFNEIAFPFLIKYSFDKFSFGLGHEIGYVVNNSIIDANMDAAILGSLNYRLSDLLSLDFRYNHSYTKLFDVSFYNMENVQFGTGGVKTRVLQFGVAYTLPSK